MDECDVITFRVDGALKEALNGVQNRSAFIRAAVLAALDGACPFCKGTGILTPHQRDHWRDFSKHHTLRDCKRCHGAHIECSPERAQLR